MNTTQTYSRRIAAPAMRLPFIDNLRWVMTMLVLSMHAADTYSGHGNWYYTEHPPLGKATELIFVTYQSFLQSFFMGLLFFVAGYFVPGAYDKKGIRRFLKDRAYRLGIPTLLYMFIIGPLTEYYISISWDPNSPDRSFIREYTHYFDRFRFPGGTGPLWFCAALLIFCALYALYRRFIAGAKKSSTSTGAEVQKFPGTKTIWSFILLIALIGFVVRLFWPKGTSFYNMQLSYFTQYIFFFAAGIMAFRKSWLSLIPKKAGSYWGRIGFFGGLALWIFLLVAGGAFEGKGSTYDGGLHWQSLGLCLWETIAGAGISLFFLVWFRERFNSQGRWAKFFSDNAFAVYVFHPPILIALAKLMVNLHPHPLLKFLLLTVLSIGVTYLLCAQVFRKLPLLKRVL